METQNIKESLGCRNLVLYKVTANTSAELTYGAGIEVMAISKMTSSTDYSAFTNNIDNRTAYFGTKKGVQKLEFEGTKIPLAVKAEILGNTVHTTGAIVENTDITANLYGLAVVETVLAEGGSETEYFVSKLCGYVELGDEEFGSKNDGSLSGDKLTFNVIEPKKKFTDAVDGKEKFSTGTVISVEDAAKYGITEEKWYATCTTPATLDAAKATTTSGSTGA